ncbi:cell number regulator 11 [Penicillium frequentans]|nr:cell number regulator 11 [Penicillium glabrum]
MEAQKEALQDTNEWSSSFWDCFSPTKTCALAWCCPCALLGRTSSRLEDPALKEYSYMNGDCCIYAATHYCYLCWVPLMMKRREIRRHFGIGGSSCNDCILACACPCCLLMQQEKEVEAQYVRLQSGYQAPAGMEYPQ